jgi:hypothetical protein
MVKSMCLKLSALCVCLVALAGNASAQAAVDDTALEQMFVKIDPNAKVKVNPDGTKLYLFKVNRENGVQLPMGVLVSPTQLTLMVMVKDPFNPLYSLEEIQRVLSQESMRLAPVYLTAEKDEAGKVAFFASRTIERSAAFEVFASQWNTFLATSTTLRVGLNK